MHIILDTNIIFNNYYLKSPRFLGLFSYLKKTKSSIFIPQTVFDELMKHYEESIAVFIKRSISDNQILFENNEIVYDLEKIINKYKSFLIRYVASGTIKIIKIKELSIKQILKRSLKEQYPFDKNDKGFRDTVIWLSIMDVLKEKPKECFCFITKNKKDFGDGKLHQNLINDLGIDIKRLKYFNSLEDFLSLYAEKLEFLNKEILESYLLKNYKNLISYIDFEKLKTSVKVTEFYTDVENIIKLSPVRIDVQDFFVYGSTREDYKIQVSIVFYLEAEVIICDFEHEIVLGSEYADFRATRGSTECWMDLSLTINKISHKIDLNNETLPTVLYAL